MKQDMIVILDLGSTENTVIARQIRDFGVYSEIHPHDITVDELNALENVKGIILNGGENRVVDGQEGAVDELRDIAGQEILMNITGTLDADGNLKQEILDLHNEIASFDNAGFTVGAQIDDSQFIAACNRMIQAAGMTQQQAEAYFADMGYDVELEEVQLPPKQV